MEETVCFGEGSVWKTEYDFSITVGFVLKDMLTATIETFGKSRLDKRKKL